MESRVVLPLNTAPSIITCIHYAYPCAIIESKELADISVNQYADSEWSIWEKGTSVEIENESLIIREVGEADDAHAVVWRECKLRDEVMIKMNYVKPRDINRSIDIFLFDDDFDNEIKAQDKSCGFRWNQYGYFIEKSIYCFDTKVYTYLKVCVDKNMLKGYASKDGLEWEGIDEIEVPEKYQSKELKIGIHAKLGNNYFTLFKNMNFVQLLYNPDNEWKGIYLDYYFFPRKNVDNSYGYFPNFLDTCYETTYEVLDCFQTIQEYIKWNIRHSYYPEICLDEFYVPKRLNYDSNHYNHYNLFYGFDDDKKVYYIMGYGSDNKPVVSELPYEILTTNIIVSEKIVKYKYRTNDNTNLKFNIRALKDNIREYVESLDSSERVANLLTQEPVYYGISILKLLATVPSAMQMLKYDRRISFCIYEHSKLAKGRLDFLKVKGYLSEYEYESLNKQSEEIIDCATTILNLIIKGIMRQKTSEIVFEKLLFLYRLEKKFYSDLLKVLT